MDKLCSDWATFHSEILHYFSSPEARFLSRIGGSDTSAAQSFNIAVVAALHPTISGAATNVEGT